MLVDKVVLSQLSENFKTEDKCQLTTFPVLATVRDTQKCCQSENVSFVIIRNFLRLESHQ